MKLLQKDLLEETESILADTVAHLNGNTLTYLEAGQDNIKHEICFDSNEIRIQRIGEISSDTHLPMSGCGVTKINSPYGPMELETQLLKSEKNEDRWTIEYQIFSGKQEVTHMKMIWELRGVIE